MVVVIAAVSQPVARASGGVVVERDIPYDGTGGPKLDVYRPQGEAASRPAVIVVHGGGWVSRDRARTAVIAQALARAGLVAFNVDYTLAAPGRPGYPGQPRELRAAVRFVRANAADYGVDRRRIGAYGSSAGGHLAALVATAGQGPLSKGERLGAVVTWGAPFVLRGFRGRVLRDRIATFLGCRRCPRRAIAASPLPHVSPDDPPMMIVHSRREKIPLSHPMRMARQLRDAGVRPRVRILSGNRHLPTSAPRVLDRTVEFLSRRLG